MRFLLQPGMMAALASVMLGLMWSAAVAPLNAPDEPAHLQAVMQVRKQGILPEIHFDPGNPAGEIVGQPGDEAARQYAISLNKTDPYLLIPYESSQPPLHYVVAAALSLPFPPEPHLMLYISRFTATLFGAATVYFLWAATRQFAPTAPMWAVGAAAVVVFLPQFCFNNVTAGNDSAATFAGAAAFYVWLRGLREPRYDPWLLKAGAMVGLGILAKLTSVALIPGLMLVVLFRLINLLVADIKGTGGFTGKKAMWLRWLRKAVLLPIGAIAGVLIVCGWWLARNVVEYGEYTGTAKALQFYKGKFALVDYFNEESRRESLESLWQSTWGRFGWMDINLPAEMYDRAGDLTRTLLLLAGVALVVGVGKWLFTRKWVPRQTWQGAIIMLAVSATLVAGFIQFNATIARQGQGRYLFIMLLPAVLTFTAGLYALPPWRFLKVIALAVPILWLAYMNYVGLVVVNSVR
jgi:4-amino-4-deoxy-L-arabinose transferase-like glycosyltransferase